MTAERGEEHESDGEQRAVTEHEAWGAGRNAMARQRKLGAPERWRCLNASGFSPATRRNTRVK